MNIPLAISKAFDPASRVRGEAYYHNGNIVKFVRAGNDRVNATVSGETAYSVQLTVDKKTLVASCTCPHFEEGNNCKHIWAVILRCGEYDTLPISKVHAIRNVAAETFGDDFDYDDDVSEWDDSDSDNDDPDVTVSKKNHHPWEKLFSIAETALPEKEPASDEKTFYHLRFDPLNPVQISVSLFKRFRKADAGWSAPKLVSSINGREYFDDESDRIILSLLAGSASYSPYLSDIPRLNAAQATIVVPMMAATGRLFLDNPRGGGGAIGPLGFDGTPHVLRARMRETGKGGWELSANVYRDDVAVDRSALVAVWRYGLIFTADSVARFSRTEGVDALHHLLEGEPVTIPAGSLPEFLNDYYTSPVRLPIDLPEEMRPEEVTLTPVPCLRLQSRPAEYGGGFLGTAHFDYDGLEAPMDPEADVLYDQENNRLLRVARFFHHESIDFLDCAGVAFVESRIHSERVAPIRKKDAVPLINKLLDAGWRVEGEKGLYKKPGKFSLSVSSGVDWFDLQASCCYEGEHVPLPRILAALRRGELFVQLGGGSMGMLPDTWLQRYERFAEMGKVEGNVVRFRKSQAFLLDVLLDEKYCLVTVDRTFSRLREELRTFGGIEPVTPDASFHGILRPYQKEGLGWIAFLERFGLGGCLADDMGLGKTVQVLAHLDRKKQLRPKRKAGEPSTSLVVAPRSLIFNWMEEAKRFAPSLRVGDFSGSDRDLCEKSFAGYDLALVTYGTLRRDITHLNNIPFYYIVLDEAQIIKNASTIAAKSARLLDGKHRLALSGTPVENRLSDLWSIFEFLNPGMLGATRAFSAIASDPGADDPAIDLLRRALKPFILRRRKSQVATDLPPRTEEVVYCEMEGAQKKEYERLKRYYQSNLLEKIEETGIDRAKIRILEALLRLRQAACHPGLIDGGKSGQSSVKLDIALARIAELRDEGHKCIVFSQFTKMLAIVKAQLAEADIAHEYLDGKTVDRKSKVDRFQSDPSCTVFLISLKAGGLGLNLTAAEYVFILDPWWNPAAEAQAIDRTHRIGQTKPVFAYKLICKDTVEEKLLELQRRKRHLADSIISSDESLLKGITVEDLKLLLG